MMVVFLIISSFQMIAIGIIGEYLWRNLEASLHSQQSSLKN
jgi:hypothetical protein